MRYYLDGNDWEADYFITNREYDHWLPNWWDIKNMYLDSAESAEFPRPNSQYKAAFLRYVFDKRQTDFVGE